MAGNYTLAVSTRDQFSGNSIHSVVTDGANNYWSAGAISGTYYFGTASSTGTVQRSFSATRVMNIFNGNLYFSSGSAPIGIYTFSGGGTPTVLTATNLFILTAGTGQNVARPYDFAINPAGTIAYVADDRGLSLGGGVQRWVFNGSVWSLAYTLSTGSTLTNGVSTNGVRSLSVDFTGANPVIYATTADFVSNRIISILDNGPNAGVAATTLVTAPSKKILRGIRFIQSSTAQPRLSFQRSKPSGGVVVTWPTNIAGFTLQSATSLDAGTNWVNVSGVPSILADQFTVTNDVPAGNRFFRLQR